MRALIFLLVLSPQAFADENWFDQGLKAYQAKNYDQARDNFEKALKNHPNEAAIPYNLGLSYFQENKKGYAVGYWRKASALDPSLPGPSIALERAEGRFHFDRLEKTPWEIALRDIYQRYGWSPWLGFLAITLAVSGGLWLRLLETRKLALATDSNEAPSPTFSLILVTLTCLLAAGLLAGKWFDDHKNRATVVTSGAELKSAPSSDGVTLANVPEAAEVLLLSRHDDWVQTRTSEGAIGWLKNTDILPTREGTAW